MYKILYYRILRKQKCLKYIFCVLNVFFFWTVMWRRFEMSTSVVSGGVDLLCRVVFGVIR